MKIVLIKEMVPADFAIKNVLPARMGMIILTGISVIIYVLKMPKFINQLDWQMYAANVW